MEILETLPLRDGEKLLIVPREKSRAIATKLEGEVAGFPTSMFKQSVQELVRAGEMVPTEDLVPGRI